MIGTIMTEPIRGALGQKIDAEALADLLGRWSAAGGPLYRLLAGRIARLTDAGELPAGLRLPAERDLAAALSVSRNTVAAAYQLLRDDVEGTVGRINGDNATLGYPAVHYLHQSYPREEMAALYLAADVMLVTPLRDGMNLVAKEYVACRDDEAGALVLSEFAGAATNSAARSSSTRTT